MWQAEAVKELTLSALPATAVGEQTLTLANRRYSTVVKSAKKVSSRQTRVCKPGDPGKNSSPCSPLKSFLNATIDLNDIRSPKYLKFDGWHPKSIWTTRQVFRTSILSPNHQKM